jgi:hypothetical protein
MEATCSFDTSIDFQRTTRLYIPKDRTRQLEEFVLVISGGQFHRLRAINGGGSVAVRKVQGYYKWSSHFETFTANGNIIREGLKKIRSSALQQHVRRYPDVSGFLLSLLFCPEDGSEVFLWNVALTQNVQNYTTLQTKISHSSLLPARKHQNPINLKKVFGSVDVTSTPATRCHACCISSGCSIAVTRHLVAEIDIMSTLFQRCWLLHFVKILM